MIADSRRLLAHCAMAIIALALVLLRAAHAATPFVHETVDAATVGGSHSSLALDAHGNPRISYRDDFPNDDLKYASKSGGVWTLETVDAAGNVGWYTSLALDAQGNPRISYYDPTNDDLKYASKSGGMWTIETVDAGGDVGNYTSLALDAQGNPRISYLDVTNFDLKYASKSGGIWTLETVDATGSVGYYASLALDAQGNPRISYLDLSNYDLKYASKSGGSWTLETVDATGFVGEFTSLALDAQGNPRISYYDVSNGDLKYASKSGGIWTLETVDAAGNVGYTTSLALDASGNPRISYLDNTNFDVKYASKSGGVWTLETVDANGFVGDYSSLALDAQGNPRISYSDAGNADLKYTDAAVHLLSPLGGERWAAGSQQTVRWSGAGTVDVQISDDGGTSYSTLLSAISDNVVVVDVPAFTTEQARVRITRSSPLSTSQSPGFFSIAPDLVSPWWSRTPDASANNVGEYTSLALDAQGNPHISYQDATTFDLKYARKVGGTWTLETPDASANIVGYYTSLALDAQGNPHISYLDFTTRDLKYARKAGGTWTLETADPSANDVGHYTSLALDAQGNPHISYLDATFGDLKYARKVGGVWTLETADASANIVGHHTSLALDAQGNPHISYWDATTADLKYARKAGGLWLIEALDATGDVGQHTSLALDAQGNPRISYYDATNLDLRYASAAIELAEPSPGVTWPVGASRTVTWDGTGRVDLYLSSDGGASWQLLQPRLTGGEHRVIVPHSPSKFAQVKLERAVPYSVSATPGLFTIQTSISLLSFAASLAPEGGAQLSWSTDPGPQDLAGYRLERALTGDDWRSLLSLTRETSYRDAGVAAGARYRLFAINGLGDELLLGEASLLPARPLAAWPLPYRGGNISVSFAIYSRLGSAHVALYDAFGRLVRTLARGHFSRAQESLPWDGRDGSGRAVPNGLYFLRLQSGGEEHRVKVVVIR